MHTPRGEQLSNTKTSQHQTSAAPQLFEPPCHRTVVIFDRRRWHIVSCRRWLSEQSTSSGDRRYFKWPCVGGCANHLPTEAPFTLQNQGRQERHPVADQRFWSLQRDLESIARYFCSKNDMFRTSTWSPYEPLVFPFGPSLQPRRFSRFKRPMVLDAPGRCWSLEALPPTP